MTAVASWIRVEGLLSACDYDEGMRIRSLGFHRCNVVLFCSVQSYTEGKQTEGIVLGLQ